MYELYEMLAPALRDGGTLWSDLFFLALPDVLTAMLAFDPPASVPIGVP